VFQNIRVPKKFDMNDALYNEDLASFDSKTFDQSLSVGNVQTHGMQSRMYWALKEKHGK